MDRNANNPTRLAVAAAAICLVLSARAVIAEPPAAGSDWEPADVKLLTRWVVVHFDSAASR